MLKISNISKTNLLATRGFPSLLFTLIVWLVSLLLELLVPVGGKDAGYKLPEERREREVCCKSGPLVCPSSSRWGLSGEEAWLTPHHHQGPHTSHWSPHHWSPCSPTVRPSNLFGKEENLRKKKYISAGKYRDDFYLSLQLPLDWNV